MRTIFAFLLAPASFGILLFGVAMLTSNVTESLPLLRIVAMIAYPVAIFVGAPLYFIFSKMGFNGFFWYALMSFLLSVPLVGYFIVWSVYLENEGDLSMLLSEARILQMVAIAFASFFTVSVFWLIARPDRAAT
jgi:hypothetical protein